jgi:predicted dinucleotide-binding enzyme
MRIAIIGSGNVGGTLGRRFVEAGHDVVFGVRPDSVVNGESPNGATVTTVDQAAASADIVLLSVPAKAIPDALGEFGAARGALDGRIVIDATNVLGHRLRCHRRRPAHAIARTRTPRRALDLAQHQRTRPRDCLRAAAPVSDRADSAAKQ